MLVLAIHMEFLPKRVVCRVYGEFLGFFEAAAVAPPPLHSSPPTKTYPEKKPRPGAHLLILPRRNGRRRRETEIRPACWKPLPTTTDFFLSRRSRDRDIPSFAYKGGGEKQKGLDRRRISVYLYFSLLLPLIPSYIQEFPKSQKKNSIERNVFLNVVLP